MPETFASDGDVNGHGRLPRGGLARGFGTGRWCP
jgi:hypothetical protein